MPSSVVLRLLWWCLPWHRSESSAKHSVMECRSSSICLRIPLMKIVNSIGSNNVSCGTPELIFRGFQIRSLFSTHRFRPVKWKWNHCSFLTAIPIVAKISSIGCVTFDLKGHAEVVQKSGKILLKNQVFHLESLAPFPPNNKLLGPDILKYNILGCFERKRYLNSPS